MASTSSGTTDSQILSISEEILSSEVAPLSKKQIKKQEKLKKYAILKKERRSKEKERQKQKKKEAQAQGITIRTGPSRKELKKHQVIAQANPNAIRVAIDLNFDNLMSERDVSKCIKQCLRIYTINRRSASSSKLHFTGIQTNGIIHNYLKKNDGWENWYISYHFDKTHLEVFPREEIIYLTSEANTILECLQTDRVYVIGGLVDHNHQKGLCHERAIKAGLKTARLPLSEFVDMKTRSVLSTYHVFEILLKVAEGKSWANAILETIPIRKGAKPKENAIDQNVKEPDQNNKNDE